MGNDIIKDIESRKAECKKEFEALDQEKKELLEKGRKINTRINEINTRQVFLNGAFTELEKIVPTTKVEVKPVAAKAA